MKKAFASWSGGKDCCQAVYKAMHQGIKILYLLNMVTQDRQRSCSHGMSAQWVRLQSEAMGIPILQQPTTNENYESIFTQALRDLKAEGVDNGVFGDIDFMPHLEWIQKVCKAAEVTPVLPLWAGDQEQIIQDFMKLGFTAVVVATRSDLLGEEWLGRKLDARFFRELAALNKEITPCGEAGEFHTLVIDGPLFRKRISILEASPVQRDNHWYWDIRKCGLSEKRGRR